MAGFLTWKPARQTTDGLWSSKRLLTLTGLCFGTYRINTYIFIQIELMKLCCEQVVNALKHQTSSNKLMRKKREESTGSRRAFSQRLVHNVEFLAQHGIS